MVFSVEMRMIIKLKKQRKRRMRGEKFAEWSLWKRLVGVLVFLLPFWGLVFWGG